MKDVKSYRPRAHSVSTGQVLKEPYSFEKARLIVREMADNLAMDVFEKGLVTDKIGLYVGYDVSNVLDPELRRRYHGEIKTDHYGRQAPKSAHGSVNLREQTSSSRIIADAAVALFERIADRCLYVRRITLCADRVVPRESAKTEEPAVQLDLFTDPDERAEELKNEKRSLERDMRQQDAVMKIRAKFGKNAILRGMNFEEGATARERNAEIGGHRAGEGEEPS